MSIDRVKRYFKELGIEDRIMEFSVSSATVSDAAVAIGCKEEEIAKTLSFQVNDKYILIVTKGTAKIDNHKYKEEFGVKSKMLDRDILENIIGHSAGGVCPFGINKDISVYLDKSLKQYNYVYPACGSSNSAIKLSLEELEKYSNYIKYVDVCKIEE